MFGAGLAKANGRLRLVVVTADVDDDALAERRMLDVVAEPQADQLRIGGCRLLGALRRGHGRFDDAFAMTLGLATVVTVDPTVRGRIGPLVARAIALPAVGAAATDCSDLIDERRRDLVDEA